MRIQIKVPLAVIPACFLIAVANSGWAASIGGRFTGRDDVPILLLDATESAGVVSQTNWNNIDPGATYKSASQSQIDSDGNFTAVKIIFDASDSWTSDGGTATPNEKLMKGIIKANPEPDTAPINNTDRMLFVITNLPPTGTYNMIVYTITDDGPDAKMDLTVGDTTYYILEASNFTTDGLTFSPALSTTPGTHDFANYAGFTNITPAANGTITITATKFIEDPQVNNGIGVAGIQLIQVSGPAPAPNTDTCSITADPQGPVFAVDGGTATFTVGAQGPRKIQWTKNNSPIPGAVNSTLVYTAAQADDGALIRAVVYNNVITNTSAPATLFVDPITPPTLTQGFLKVERWENIDTNVGLAGIGDLITAMQGGAPTTTYFVPGANVPTTNPNVDAFGARVSGWVKPDVTGYYDFFLRSDDSSQLFLNSVNPGSGTNALPDVNTDAPICQEDTAAGPFREPPASQTTATPIFLEAGKLYGLVAIYKDGTLSDYVQVAWRLTNSPVSAALLKPIAPLNCWTMASGAGQRANISTEPTSKTVFEARTASFTVGVTTLPIAGIYGVQWLKNGSAIPGAVTATYTTPPTTLGDSNSLFRANVYTLRGPLTSAIATLTVLADTNPPIVTSAGAIIRNDGVVQVGLTFDEGLNPATVIPGNFTPNAGSVTSVRVATNSYNDYAAVVLNTSGLTSGNTYTFNVHSVTDLRGNSMAATNVSVTVGRVGWAETGTPKVQGQVVPIGADGFDILNGGRGEWGTYDEATIAYVKKTNDFDVKVRIVYAEPGSQWTRVGLIARNDLNVGQSPDDRNSATGTASAYAQTHVNPNDTLVSSSRFDPSGATPINPTPNNGHEQNQRLMTGGATSAPWGTGVSGVPVYPNVWLRLQRQGSTLHGYRGEDGVNWVDQGTTTLTNQQPDMYVGPVLSLETANLWATADHDVWISPFDPRYDRLVVAQFRNFGNTVGPSLSVIKSGNDVVITFTGTGLVSAPAVTGPWTQIVGATSPYSTPATNSARYFRALGEPP